MKWSLSEVRATRHPDTSGCLRETWRFTLNGGVLTLRGYTREALPTKRHRKWVLVDQWGSNRRGDDTLNKEQVPMNNALAVDILAQVALSLEIDHNGLLLPSLGYRLSGEEVDSSTT